VIVHFHIFKNGGTTIEAILTREFSGRFGTVHGLHANSALDGDDIAVFIRMHPNVSALSSHHLRYPLPSIRRTILYDCCFLRHPLDRLQSVYSFLRTEPAELWVEDPIRDLSQTVGPREFMRRLLNEFPHFVSNAQTLLIAAGGVLTRPLDEADLALAVETLRRMAIPGLVKMFDESMVAAEYFLRPAFPNLRLHYVAQNVSRPSWNLDQRLEELRTLWGRDVYEDLLHLNRLDLELCACAENEIHRRFCLVPNRQARLMEFRTRCSDLRLSIP